MPIPRQRPGPCFLIRGSGARGRFRLVGRQNQLTMLGRCVTVWHGSSTCTRAWCRVGRWGGRPASEGRQEQRHGRVWPKDVRRCLHILCAHVLEHLSRCEIRWVIHTRISDQLHLGRKRVEVVGKGAVGRNRARRRGWSSRQLGSATWPSELALYAENVI